MTIETKYSIGQTVWFMHDNKTVNAIVTLVNVKRYNSGHQIETYELNTTASVYSSDKLYGSKDELLKSL